MIQNGYDPIQYSKNFDIKKVYINLENSVYFLQLNKYNKTRESPSNKFLIKRTCRGFDFIITISGIDLYMIMLEHIEYTEYDNILSELENAANKRDIKAEIDLNLFLEKF